MKKFDKNGIYFEHPENMVLVEEEWDDQISALTLEDDAGIYMIDIYYAGAGPDLKYYANKHFKSFVKELPFFSKVISSPISTNTTEFGISGVVLEFVVKSFFLFKTSYVNPIFKVSGERSVSYISGQYPKSKSKASSAALNHVLGSYNAS